MLISRDRSLVRLAIYRQLETHFPQRLVYSIFGDAVARRPTWADRPYMLAGRFLNASNAPRAFHPRRFLLSPPSKRSRGRARYRRDAIEAVKMSRIHPLKARTWERPVKTSLYPGKKACRVCFALEHEIDGVQIAVTAWFGTVGDRNEP